MQAIRLVETKGLVGVTAAADALLKAANVQLVKRIDIGDGLVTVIVSGDVGSVRVASDACIEVAGQPGILVGSRAVCHDILLFSA